MTDIDSYVKRLTDAMTSTGLAQTELALRTRLHVNTIRKIGQKHWNPSLDTLRRLDRFLLSSDKPAERVAKCARRKVTS